MKAKFAVAALLGLVIAAAVLRPAPVPPPEWECVAPQPQEHCPQTDTPETLPAATLKQPAPPTVPLLESSVPSPSPAYTVNFALADKHYKQAEKCYHSGEFERSRRECALAIQHDPDHAAAHALKIEIEFLMGNPKALEHAIRERTMAVQTSRPDPGQLRADLEELDGKWRVARMIETTRTSQALVALSQKLKKGKDLYLSARYDEAFEEFSDVLAFARWMPIGPDQKRHREEAEYWLACLGGATQKNPEK